MKIYRIVLTGGPCAGKTTYLNDIKNSFKKNNIKCIIVPEAATILINKGFDPAEWNPLKFQEMILERELLDEKENAKYIEKYGDKYDTLVIVYDRGICDNRAYLNNQDEYRDLLIKYQLDGMQVLDYYDMVFDLLSMATCKPSAYTTSNNSARKEMREFAKNLDKRTANAWANHRNMKIISGSCSQEEESENILRYVYDFLNGKNVIETQEFIVDDVNSDFSGFGEMETLGITDTYLKINTDGNTYKLSKRAGFGCSYVLEVYTYQDGKKILKSSKMISKEGYDTLYNSFEHLGQDIRREFSFVDNETLYRLAFYDDRTVLKVQKNDFNDIIIPDYIKVFNRDDDNHLIRKLHK